MRMQMRKYVEIMKPGIVFGNVIPVVSGYLLAARGGDLRWGAFAATLAGSALGIASACVFNNVIDREADARMERTKHRAIVKGHVSVPAALVFGSVLGFLGSAILFLAAGFAPLAAGAVGFFFYIFMYSMWWKPRSPIGTAMGSVAGAMPPVVGYVAARGGFDLMSVVLFGIMVAWQMPHFFAIAIRRKDEYAAARFPVLPVVRGVRATKVQMLLYIAAFTLLAPLPAVIGGAGTAYLVVSLLLGVSWLALCLEGFRIPEGGKKEIAWARGMFDLSLAVMIALFATMALAAVA